MKKYVLITLLLLLAPSAKTSQPDDYANVIQALDNRTSSPPALRLKVGLIPPTNKWFSSLVFASRPQPVFAYPLSMRPAGNGIEFDYPQVSATEDAVFGTHRPSVRLGFAYDEYQVSSYDDLSVDIVFIHQGNEIFHLKLTQGSPFAFITAKTRVNLSIDFDGQHKDLDPGYRILSTGGRQFGVVVPSGRLQSDGARLEAGEDMAVFAMDGALSEKDFRRYATDPIIRTGVDYELADNLVKTSYSFVSKSGGPQLFAAAPHMDITGLPATGSYESILGKHKVFSGVNFTSENTAEAPPLQLNLHDLGREQRARLVVELSKEAPILKLHKTDSYFGGKELYRAANLLEIAAQLGMEADKLRIQQELSLALSTWFLPRDRQTANNRYFYYDTTLKGLVGATPAFGSEMFNDHHFHYGYFIYASAVLARYDKQFLRTNRQMIDALVSAIASPGANRIFPRLRVFDLYAGHSWASGYSDFADGNNQESTSEAIQAWYAAYLWAKETGNNELQQLSRWIYNQETDAARTYWLRLNNPAPSPYKHSFVSLLWSGKLDYATFFSTRPQAKLGIQLIPMSPGSIYLEDTRSISSELLASVLVAGADDYGQFSDYLIMYQAMFNQDKALLQYEDLEDIHVDDANSRTYMLAWILTR